MKPPTSVPGAVVFSANLGKQRTCRCGVSLQTCECHLCRCITIKSCLYHSCSSLLYVRCSVLHLLLATSSQCEAMYRAVLCQLLMLLPTSPNSSSCPSRSCFVQCHCHAVLDNQPCAHSGMKLTSHQPVLCLFSCNVILLLNFQSLDRGLYI